MSDIANLTIAGAPVFINKDLPSFRGLISKSVQSGSLHLICDTNTYTHCLPFVSFISESVKDPIIIPAGEQYKNLKTCQTVWRSLVQQGANRHSTVINLGGGVVTDLGGFCAATYMRGIGFVHMPTTLLGMCDAALGGKHGVDFEGWKNYIGVIQQPQWIWIFTPFLSTLPIRQYQSGLAEVVKHAMIGDPGLFASLDLDSRQVENRFLIPAIEVKKRFVEGDVQDHKMRAALNFGHTFGHAIESYFLTTETPLLHGECVALGMIIETWLSHFHLGEPDREICRKITALIRKLIPVDVPEEVKLRELMPYLSKDKKQQGGLTRYSLIRDLGKPVIGQEVKDISIVSLLEDNEVALFLPWLLR